MSKNKEGKKESFTFSVFLERYIYVYVKTLNKNEKRTMKIYTTLNYGVREMYESYIKIRLS